MWTHYSLFLRSGYLFRGVLLLLALGMFRTTIADDRFHAFDLGHIEVGGEIGRRIDVTINNNLLVINVDDDFLKPFQEKTKSSGYIGLGKLIDSAVRLAAYSNDPRVIERKKHLVRETIRTQEPDGYIGILKPESRISSLWDVHEMGYVIFGLTSDYRFFGEKSSLDAATKLADYIMTHWQSKPELAPGGGSITLHMAVTGIESAMLALAKETGKTKYRDFCVDFRKLPQWKARIVQGRWGQIEGHAYAHMCRCVAQLRLNRVQPEERLFQPSHDVVDFLTRADGLVITGTCGDHECWHSTQQGTINLGETCTTAYLVRLMDELFRIEGNTLYADVMERAIFNSLFAAQSPDGRRIRYYTPFDGPRQYFHADTYCCPCNYRRIIAELPQMLYYRSDKGVMVNLYTASKATLPLGKGVSVGVRQETKYPRSGHVVLHINPSQETTFTLQLRIPRWCKGASCSVNGQPVGSPLQPGSLFAIERLWKAKDRVELELPMPWRLVRGRKGQAGCVAVMRGPQVFCVNRKRHEKLADLDLRLLTLDPASLEGPQPDDTAIPKGVACRARAWGPGLWYPSAKCDLELVLTEFPDPDGEAVYFHVPNPNDARFVDDELVVTDKKK